jgi:hypothetical protein
LDPDKNFNTIGSVWSTDTITLAPTADTIDWSSLTASIQQSDIYNTVSITNGGTGAIGSGNLTIGGGNLTMGHAGSYTFSNAYPNTVWTTNTTAAHLEQSGKMSLRGENADLDINGKSLKNWMEKVEERLNLLTPNPELEKEWDELRRLGERYRRLEKKCQEKAKMWSKLKSMPKPETK